MNQPWTLLDSAEPRDCQATSTGDSVCIDPVSLQSTLGWQLRPEGLCRDDVCLLVPDRAALVRDEGIDLTTLAALLDRPLALDRDERVAALGTAHTSRASQMNSLAAPDFELPDIHGQLHSLSDHAGKKVLLIAYASW